MSNENSTVEYESGVTFFPMGALTDSGDATTFTSSALLFSESTGNAPKIAPDGLLTGGAVSPAASATVDAVDITALTASLAGVNTSVAAGVDVTITRPATNVASVHSVTVTSGGAIAIIAGTDSVDATFSEARNVAGGAPLIPVGSIEIGQIRVIDNVSAVITAQEIFSVIGTHVERSDFPVFTIDNASAAIKFATSLPLIHTGALSKGVFASYADPIFLEQTFANDFVPAETSFSTSSTQVYGATIGSSSSSLGQGSFTAILKDGITDGIIGRKGENLWFRYFQDKNKLPHILTQGKLGIGRTFGAADNPSISCTISPTVESIDRAS